MSLSPNGTPWSGPRDGPAEISASAWRACRRARSNVRVMKARVWVSCCSTRWISASTSSTGERRLSAICFDSAAIDRSWRSAVMGRARSEGELGLSVDVDQHRVRDVADADRLHERELGREGLPGERILLRPLEPHRDREAAELLDVVLGEPDDLDALGLVLLPGRDVLLLDVGVLVPGVLPGRRDHQLLERLGQGGPPRPVDGEVPDVHRLVGG